MVKPSSPNQLRLNQWYRSTIKFSHLEESFGKLEFLFEMITFKITRKQFKKLPSWKKFRWYRLAASTYKFLEILVLNNCQCAARDPEISRVAFQFQRMQKRTENLNKSHELKMQKKFLRKILDMWLNWLRSFSSWKRSWQSNLWMVVILQVMLNTIGQSYVSKLFFRGEF